MASFSPISNDLIAEQKRSIGNDSASKQLAANKHDFLKLLTVQIQNQDPLDPIDSTEFVSQLVQFSSIEQSIEHNKKLDTLIELQRAQQANQAVHLIGKNIKYEGKVLYFDGEHSVDATVNLPTSVPHLNCVVFNDKGRIVHNETIPALAGPHTFHFNGIDKNNQPLNTGAYRIEINALDGNYLPLKDHKDYSKTLPIFLQGKVTNVEIINGSPVLNIGNVPVTLDKIDAFFEAPGSQASSNKILKPLEILPLPSSLEQAMAE